MSPELAGGLRQNARHRKDLVEVRKADGSVDTYRGDVTVESGVRGELTVSQGSSVTTYAEGEWTGVEEEEGFRG